MVSDCWYWPYSDSCLPVSLNHQKVVFYSDRSSDRHLRPKDCMGGEVSKLRRLPDLGTSLVSKIIASCVIAGLIRNNVHNRLCRRWTDVHWSGSMPRTVNRRATSGEGSIDVQLYDIEMQMISISVVRVSSILHSVIEGPFSGYIQHYLGRHWTLLRRLTDPRHGSIRESRIQNVSSRVESSQAVTSLIAVIESARPIARQTTPI